MKFAALAVWLWLAAPAAAAEQGFLGVATQPVVDQAGVPAVAVQAVVPGSPAAAAGIQPGDVFLSFGGERPTDGEHLTRLCRATAPGDPVAVTVWRGGAELQLTPVLTTRAALERSVVGQPAPGFSLAPLAGGEDVALAALSGRVVVLDFWASWCAPCVAAVPALNALAADRPGLTLLGITSEPAEHAARVAGAMAYPVLLDTTREASLAYGVTSLPTVVVIDRAGVVREIPGHPIDYQGLGRLVDALLAEDGPDDPN